MEKQTLQPLPDPNGPFVMNGHGPTTPQIEDLKKNWLADPCYDLEDTPGFESVKAELIDFRTKEQIKAEQRWEQYLRRRAEKMGLDITSTHFKYMLSLEDRVEKLESILEKHNLY